MNRKHTITTGFMLIISKMLTFKNTFMMCL